MASEEGDIQRQAKRDNDQQHRSDKELRSSSSRSSNSRSSLSSASQQKEDEQGRRGSIGEQLFGMKKKMIVNQVDIKRKGTAESKNNYGKEDEQCLINERQDSNKEKELEQKLKESEGREESLNKRIEELENLVKTMSHQLERFNDQNRLSPCPVSKGQNKPNSGRKQSIDDKNLLTPNRRSSDGRVSPSSGT